MSMRNVLLAACSLLLFGYGAALAQSPNLGKVASPEEIASWDVSIGPDGANLPPGSGTRSKVSRSISPNALRVMAREAQASRTISSPAGKDRSNRVTRRSKP